MQSIARHNQRESFRYPGLAGHLQRRAGGGEVADKAFDNSAAELNRRSFQDAMARCASSFDHMIAILQIAGESIKLFEPIPGKTTKATTVPSVGSGS
jgi:hypothetical protein